MTVVFCNIFDDRPSHVLNALRTVLKLCHYSLECLFLQLLLCQSREFLFCEWEIHCKHFEVLLFASCKVVVVQNRGYTIPKQVRDIHSYTLSHKGMTTAFIDDCTLLVHYVIILKQTLTDTEVIFLYLLLGTLDALRDKWTFDSLTLLEAETVHNLCDTLRSEQTHKLILERYIEYRRTWVSLTTCTTTELTVNTTALMTFCTDDCKTTCSLYLWSQFDIRTTTSHVCCDSYCTKTVY